MRLSGAYFDLTDRFAPGAARTAGTDAALRCHDRILISVAKRLVPSAVRRNTVKRIVREAWRAALRNQPVAGSMQEAVAQEVQECLIRLTRYPGPRPAPARARRRGSGAARGQAPGQVPAAAMGLTAIKRSLRADADQLFAAYLHRRPALRPKSRARSRRPG